MKFTRKQSGSLWVDVNCGKIADIDANWENWSGRWCISSSAGATPLLTGNLIKTNTLGVFALQIGPTSGGSTWLDLPDGEYVLSVEINNATVDYRQEEQDTLIIETRGLQ